LEEVKLGSSSLHAGGVVHGDLFQLPCRPMALITVTGEPTRQLVS
jgi:hypothetical protein